MEENNTKIEISEFDKAKFISEYEILNSISFNERITTYFNDYALDIFKNGVDENTINETYNKALEFVGITENELIDIIKHPSAGDLIRNYYYNQVLENNDLVMFDNGEKYRISKNEFKASYIFGLNPAVEGISHSITPRSDMIILEQGNDVVKRIINQQHREHYLIKEINKFVEEIAKSNDYEKQIEILRNEITSIKQDYNYDDRYKYDESFINHNKMLEQLMYEYKEFNSSLFLSIKESNELDIEKIDIKKDIIAAFNNVTGNYVNIKIETEKEIEPIASDEKINKKILTNLRENQEITLDKILDEIVNRTDIKTLTLDIHIDGNYEEFATSNELGKSIDDAVEKVREVVKDFEDIVIVYSMEELEYLQKEWRERNGIEEPKEKAGSMIEEKSYEDTKAEFAEKINNNENVSKGYVRISDDDFSKLGDILDKNELPYVANKSEKKDGINITVPIDKMDSLKEILYSKDVKLLQIVHGNIDWQNIKDSKPNVFTNVTKEEFMKFQELNNNQHKFIAFENKKGFSVYTDRDCKIAVKFTDNSKEKPTEKGASNKKSNNKTLSQVKKSVEDTKKENALKETQNKEKTDIVKSADKSSKTMEKSNNNKER